MDEDQFQGLKRGDIIRGKYSNRSFVVMGHYGSHVTAVATVDMTNPAEWDIILKSNYNKEEDK